MATIVLRIGNNCNNALLQPHPGYLSTAMRQAIVKLAILTINYNPLLFATLTCHNTC